MSHDPRIDRNATAQDIQAVRLGLLAFNEARIGPADERPVHLVVRDEAGAVIGGLLGHTRWRWLYVATLWVSDSARGQGWGTRLLAAAEDEARALGCVGVWLDTFEYQARPFYERLGYQVNGTLEGYPPGYRQYFLHKRL
jgi:GNAT superfamily N-acetyltransferase